MKDINKMATQQITLRMTDADQTTLAAAAVRLAGPNGARHLPKSAVIRLAIEALAKGPAEAEAVR